MGKIKKVVQSEENPKIEKKQKNSLSKVKSPKNKKKKLSQSPGNKATARIDKKALISVGKKSDNLEDIVPVEAGSLLRNLEVSKVREEDITSAVNALFQLLKQRKKGKKELFNDEDYIFMQVNTIKVPKCPSRIIRFPLAYSILNAESEICLITPDLKNTDPKNHDKNIEHYEAILKSQGINNIKTIIPYHQLRTEYEEYEMQSRFVELYDFFLVDGAVAGYFAKKFQGTFMKKNKMPGTVKLHVTNLKSHVEKALLQAQMRIHAKGDSYCVKIGNVQMSVEQITANALAIHDGLNNAFPGGMGNVRSLQIKSELSPSIPIYFSLKNQSEVLIPIIEPKKLKASSVTVRGELTTRANTEVSVLPSGKILVHDIPNQDDESDEEEIFEGEEQEIKTNKQMQNGIEEETNEENTKEEEIYLMNLKQEVEEKAKIKKEKQLKKKVAAKDRKSETNEKISKKSERIRQKVETNGIPETVQVTKKIVGKKEKALNETVTKKPKTKKQTVNATVPQKPNQKLTQVTVPKKDNKQAIDATIPKKASKRTAATEAATELVTKQKSLKKTAEVVVPKKVLTKHAEAGSRTNKKKIPTTVVAETKKSKRMAGIPIEEIPAKKVRKVKISKSEKKEVVAETKPVKASKSDKVVFKKAKRMSMKAQ